MKTNRRGRLANPIAPAFAVLAASAAGQSTERMSVDSSGAQANSSSYFGGETGDTRYVSADGRHVAFSSWATNLVAEDTNGFIDVFVRDRQSGTTRLVSVSNLGVQANADSLYPSISADGRWVAFSSEANNLVHVDTNADMDVFLHHLESGVTQRVSVDSLEVPADNDCYQPSVSANGRYVAFAGEATNLASGDTNGTTDVFVRDLWNGTTECVSIDSGGVPGQSLSYAPSISADGRYVAFESNAANLVNGDTNGYADVFVRDRQNGITECVSVDSLGAQANEWSRYISISADGQRVAFCSWATNLVSGDANGTMDVFVHDRQSGTTERVSVDSLDMEAHAASVSPSISGDGRYVAFSSEANLVDADTNGYHDVFVRDLQIGTTERASVSSLGNEANSGGGPASISADGRHVVFASSASNLVSGDTNSTADVFLRDRCGSVATSAIFAGDGINADTVAPVEAVLGSTWSAPLTIGHAHGAGGPLSLNVRTATFNGANFHSPMGGRLTEFLVTGALLATLTGSHDGTSGGVPPQTIPNQFSLVGAVWAAQYVVVGGGFGDLSQAVHGTVGCE